MRNVILRFGSNGGAFRIKSVFVTSTQAAGEFVCLDLANATNEGETISLRVFNECPTYNKAKALAVDDLVYNVNCEWTRIETIGNDWEREVKTRIKLISFEKLDTPKEISQLSKSASTATIGCGDARYQIISDMKIDEKGFISFMIANEAATEERYVMRCFPDAPYYDLVKKLKRGDTLRNIECTLAKRSTKDHNGKYRDDYLFGIRTFEKVAAGKSEAAAKATVEPKDIKPLDIPLGFGE